MRPDYRPCSARPGSFLHAVPLAALVALAAACSWPAAGRDGALSEPELVVTEDLSGGTSAAAENGAGNPAAGIEQTPTPAPYNLSTPAVLIERPEPPTEIPPPTPVWCCLWPPSAFSALDPDPK